MSLEALSVATCGTAGRVFWLDEQQLVFPSGNGIITQDVGNGAQVTAIPGFACRMMLPCHCTAACKLSWESMACALWLPNLIHNPRLYPFTRAATCVDTRWQTSERLRRCAAASCMPQGTARGIRTEQRRPQHPCVFSCRLCTPSHSQGA